MTPIFSADYTLRAADFGIYSRLRPSSVLDLFQDAAGRHAMILGCGTESLRQKGLAWVLVKQRFTVLCPAKMYESVTVSTWPLAPGRVGLQREYRITDAAGRPLVEGSSEWVLMDIAARRIAHPDVVYNISDFCTEKIYPEGFPRLRSFEPEAEYACLPPFSDFDLNGHVNNTKYANFLLDALCPPREDIIRDFRLDYHRELLPGREVKILHRRDGSTVTARGESQGEKMFSCTIDFVKES